jgi:hypothetical protein
MIFRFFDMADNYTFQFRIMGKEKIVEGRRKLKFKIK